MYAHVIVCSFDPYAFCPAQGKSFFIKVVLEFIYDTIRWIFFLPLTLEKTVCLIYQTYDYKGI